MEPNVVYEVVPRGEGDFPVGYIKDGFWYELGQSIPSAQLDEDGSFSVGGCYAKVEGLRVIRDDGNVFDLVPKR